MKENEDFLVFFLSFLMMKGRMDVLIGLLSNFNFYIKEKCIKKMNSLNEFAIDDDKR